MRRPTFAFNVGETQCCASKQRCFNEKYPEGTCNENAVSSDKECPKEEIEFLAEYFPSSSTVISTAPSASFISEREKTDSHNEGNSYHNFSEVMETSGLRDLHKARKRKERQDSISSITQEKKLVRSNSEERPIEKQKAESGCEIRRVFSHGDFLPLQSRDEGVCNTNIVFSNLQPDFDNITDQINDDIDKDITDRDLQENAGRSTSPTRSNLNCFSQSLQPDYHADFFDVNDHESRRQVERFSRIKTPPVSSSKADGFSLKNFRFQRASRRSPSFVTNENDVQKSSSSQQRNKNEGEKTDNNFATFSWSDLSDFRPVLSFHAENLKSVKSHSNDSDLDDMTPTTCKFKKITDNHDIIAMTECHARKYELYSKTLLENNNTNTAILSKDYNDAIFVTSSEERLKQICKKLSELKKRITKHEDAFEFENGYRMSQIDKIADKNINKIYNKIQKLRKEKLRLKIDPSFSMSNYGKIVTNLQDLESHDNIFERNLEKFKHGLAEVEQLADKSDASQKALLLIEAHCNRYAVPETMDFGYPIQNRYRQLKRFVFKSHLSKIKPPVNELETILENETMDFVSIDSSEGSNLSLSQQQIDDVKADTLSTSAVCAKKYSFDKMDISTPVVETIPNNMNPLAFNIPSNSSVNANLHNLSLDELKRQLISTYEEKKQLRKSIKEYEHHYEIRTGKRLHRKDRTNMETTYGLYKQIKAKLKLLEALVNKQKPK